MRCIITGCTLSDTTGRWVNGDLFDEGDCFIFNALVSEGETAWQYRHSPHRYPRELHIGDERQFFERRGVIVIEKLRCSLNTTARLYLKGTEL